MAKKRTRVPIVLVGEPWTEDDLELRSGAPKVLVGEPWTPEDADVVEPKIKLLRARMAVGAGVFFAVLLAGYVTYGMAVHDAWLVHEGFTVCKTGGYGVLGWIVGVHI